MNSTVTLETSNATNMSEMFRDTPKFNGEINFNGVSKVSDMSKMFWAAWVFNRPLNLITEIQLTLHH